MFRSNKDYLQEAIRKSKTKAIMILGDPTTPQQNENGKYLITYDFLHKNQLTQLWANYFGIRIESIRNDYFQEIEATEAKELGFI